MGHNTSVLPATDGVVARMIIRANRRSAKRDLRLEHFREVPGENYGTPKEVWGFSLRAGGARPDAVARKIIQANAHILGLDGTELRLRRVRTSVGGSHVIFSQIHLETRIHRAYVTVHMNRRNEVYLIKNRAVPERLLPKSPGAELGLKRIEHRARKAAAGRKDRKATLLEREKVWFHIRARLHLAYKFRFRVRKPRRHEWIIYVDAVTGKVLSKYDNLANATGRAQVFNPNPVVALGDWHSLLKNGKPVRRIPNVAYKPVTLLGIRHSGILSGSRVSTRLTRNRLRRPSLDFIVASDERGFEEVMAYYHVDRAIRYVESLGYRNKKAIFKRHDPKRPSFRSERSLRPLEINARASTDDQSWYSPGTRSLAFGTGGVDDAEDGETILHEFGHALQDAICPDFGQSLEGAAIGEGFGDFWAASYFAEAKIAARAQHLLPAIMTWDGIADADHDVAQPPCIRRVDGTATFESFDHSKKADEHENGKIWSATLWDIWKAVGRRIADRIVVESHFQLDGFTTFARAARAILDADRNLFGGRECAALRRIFRRRGIGPIE